MTRALRWTLDELGRVMMTHALPREPIAAVLGIAVEQLDALANGQPAETHDADPEAAAMVLNILVRLETRCGGDSIAIAAALQRPCDAPGGSIAAALADRPDLPALRRLREIAGTLPVPRVKMWRCADRYS